MEKPELIPLTEIGPEDETFAISLPGAPMEALLESVRRAGILSPLHIQEQRRGKKRIVRGFRRYRAAQELGMEAVPCVVHAAHEDVPSLFLQALMDNVAKRPLHLLEAARALHRLYEFGFKEETLTREFLPLFGIRGDRFHFQECLRLASLPENLQRAVRHGLETEIAVKLSGWSSEEQDFVLELMERYQLGRNRQRELFSLLDELRAGPGESAGKRLGEVWEESEAGSVDREERIPPQERLQQILTRLRAVRFPVLAQHERRYQELKKALKIPPSIQLQAPPGFEGDRLTVSFSVRGPEELRALAETMRQLSKRPELEEIFKLL